jgi:hypothetical protein
MEAIPKIRYVSIKNEDKDEVGKMQQRVSGRRWKNAEIT